MTINSTIRKAGPYLGDGTTVTLPFGFKVFSAADLKVVRASAAGVETTLTLGSDYSVTLNANQDTTPGGSVVLAAAAAGGTRTTIGSAIGPLQPVQLANNGGFYADVLNGGLDRLTILVQQLIEEMGRSLRVPFSDVAGGTEMATSVARANKLLGFDSSGRPAYTSPASGSTAELALYLAGGFSVDVSGNLLINKLASSPRVLATATDDSGTPDAAMRVTRTLSALTAGGGHGFRDDTTASGGVAGTGYAAFDAQHTLSAAGFDHIVSFQSRPIVTGNPTHVYGTSHAPVFNAGANAVNSYGLFAFNPTGAGTVQNVYGLYVPMQTKGSVSNYPIYVAQQGSPSFFGSPLQVNNLLTIDPAAPYIVGGLTTIDYPYAGYNYNPSTGQRPVADVVVTTKLDTNGFRIFTKATGAAGAVTPDEMLRCDIAGNHYGPAGAAGMVNGFQYMPSGAGVPGAPAVQPAGRVPFYFDTSTNKVGVYVGGAWKWTAALA